MQKTNVFLPALDAIFILMSEVGEPSFVINSEQQTTEILRQRIKDALQAFECQAQEQMISAESVYKAKYALVAYLDEFMLNLLQGETSWATYPLQLELFGDLNAGGRFFDILAEMRLNAALWIDVLEVFYLCLEFGYRGRYQFEDDYSLMLLKKELLSQIEQMRHAKDVSLLIASTPPSSSVIEDKKTPWKKMVMASLLLLTGFYLTCQTALYIKAKQDRKTISHFVQKL